MGKSWCLHSQPVGPWSRFLELWKPPGVPPTLLLARHLPVVGIRGVLLGFDTTLQVVLLMCAHAAGAITQTPTAAKCLLVAETHIYIFGR